ncbi:hypothetical protein CSC19_3844 [Enterobacter hormaechei]|nr:hypothetical protein CSC19_3844 [Enterobacter hormaechei]AWZ99877.1 hypothetical protein CSB67_0095 [Enterobacter hormaechei]KAF0681349.1 hypothetical protein Y59_08200 [Enterobacter hormaechei]
MAASPYRAYNGELIVGRVSAAPPGFFVKKLRRKTAGKKQKFPINAVT